MWQIFARNGLSVEELHRLLGAELFYPGDFAIETRDLTRRYGNIEAVRSLNLKVTRQHITGFLGRNGAGKSTTIRMLLGMTHPSGGEGTVLGHAITNTKSSLAIRRSVAYVGEDKELYSYMTVGEMIRFTASFYSDWRPEVARRLQSQYELPSSRRVSDLSKGMRTKLALLLALARRPELLILDEPSDGLDPVSIDELLQSLVAAAAERHRRCLFGEPPRVDRRSRAHCRARQPVIERGKLVKDLALDEMRQQPAHHAGILDAAASFPGFRYSTESDLFRRTWTTDDHTDEPQ